VPPNARQRQTTGPRLAGRCVQLRFIDGPYGKPFLFVNERTDKAAVSRVFFMKTQKLGKLINFHVQILNAFSTYLSRGFAPHNLSSGAKKAE
jgi:hypothetical protein